MSSANVLTSTVEPIGALDDDQIALGFLDYGHWHQIEGLVLRMNGTSYREVARWNAAFTYWIQEDERGSWWVVSSLDGGNAYATVDESASPAVTLTPGRRYIVEHISVDGIQCDMRINEC